MIEIRRSACRASLAQLERGLLPLQMSRVTKEALSLSAQIAGPEHAVAVRRVIERRLRVPYV